ncbi:TetR/AcrR family transcriptional regulator [Segnochrobactrum spirostomi]|uniref:TetR/AcrR family transcriptional regulator n=1 Tax=Segnochrobactrum spirostomi TaxID=2608987 RepID=A0A6A7Y6Z1_9HYPH|nr:TetR/AcrR family transcriptional regulator [Segnochrobactrum spirostomi]MQT15100.1 TetR/AcrR family transcriptional regulator [Segnochrobactrum spirostomi]
MRSKSEAVRNRILDVAGEMFLRNGYGSVNMSHISAALGGSKTTLYNHFPTKDLLFQAYMLQQGKDLFDALADIKLVAGDTRGTLIRFGCAYLRLVLSPKAIATNRLVIGECERFPELGRIFYETGVRITIDKIVEMMEALDRHSLLRAENTHLAAMTFKAMMEMDLSEKSMWGVIDPPDEASILQSVTTAVDAFLNHFGQRA